MYVTQRINQQRSVCLSAYRNIAVRIRKERKMFVAGWHMGSMSSLFARDVERRHGNVVFLMTLGVSFTYLIKY